MIDDFDKLIDKERVKLAQIFEQKHENLLKVTKIFEASLQNSLKQGWTTHAQLWNIGIYINIVAHDLSVLVWHLCCERDSWARKLASRHLILLIYEITKDTRQLFGKTLRDPLEKLGVLTIFESQLVPSHGDINSFWNKHSKNLKNVRITSAAHRDNDGLVLLHSIENIDPIQAYDLGIELGNILNQCGAVIQAILTKTASIQPPEI